MSGPVICFGQQPCGIFPKRFLVAKFWTARKLQAEIGGEIVFFYHDSDHDPRETRTIVRHRASGDEVQLNFEYENKWQRKYSPLYLKRVPGGWAEKTARALPNYVCREWVRAFEGAASRAGNVGDFCLEVYREMGLLEGVRVVRSSDPTVRTAACEVGEYFADVPHEGEVVRARVEGEVLKLHEGGEKYIVLPQQRVAKGQLSPTRDSRLRWMQSVIRCTHYVCGAGEQQYLNTADAPEIAYVKREEIERSDEAYVDPPNS